MNKFREAYSQIIWLIHFWFDKKVLFADTVHLKILKLILFLFTNIFIIRRGRLVQR